MINNDNDNDNDNGGDDDDDDNVVTLRIFSLANNNVKIIIMIVSIANTY